MADISWVKTGDRYIVNKSGIYHGATLTKGDILEITTTRYTAKELDASVYVDTAGTSGGWVLSPKILLEACTMVTKDATTRDVQEGDIYIVNVNFNYGGASIKKDTILTVRKPAVNHIGLFMTATSRSIGGVRMNIWSLNKNAILANCTLHTVKKAEDKEVKAKVAVKRLEKKDFLTALKSI